MICKEEDYSSAIAKWQELLDNPSTNSQLRKQAQIQIAGLRAEKDMAYHLKVYFGENDHFAVFNNLKYEYDGQTAQIDHLVLTRWTAYFIESKSISQIITVNEHGEWGRIYNRRFMPIESPLEQSRRHKEILYNFMTTRRDEFMRKFVGIRMHFRALLTPVHFVAISSNGQIRGRGRRLFPQVKKSDLIPQAIKTFHKELNNGLFSLSAKEEDWTAFNKKEFKAVIEFLLKEDIATSPVKSFEEIVRNTESALEVNIGERDASDADMVEVDDGSVQRRYACRKCESEDIHITSGPYGYYFKCNKCDGNTPIVEHCDNCSEKMRVAKAGDVYSLCCTKCGIKSLFWTSKPLPVKLKAKPEQSQSTTDGKSADNQSTQKAPLCPSCGMEMVLRKAKRGKNAGQEFWGCKRYPQCHGVVAIKI